MMMSEPITYELDALIGLSTPSATRADIVRVVRTFLGTKFHDRGRTPGLALDCAGVLICAARALGLVAPDFDVPDYTGVPDGKMTVWCDRYMTRIQKSTMQPGDAIAIITDEEPQHLGILTDYRNGGLAIVHASNDTLHMRVIETRLMFSRHFRFGGAWRMPGIA
jgi:hypothetical protein